MKGKDLRLDRMMGPADGRSFIVAADHPYMTGPAEGTYDLGATLAEIVKAGPDGILLSRGSARGLAHLFEGAGAPALIIRADWFSAPRIFNDFAPLHSIDKFLAVSAGEAFAAGADAVMVYHLAGFTPEFEEKCWEHTRALLPDCERLGLPLIVEPLIGNPSLEPGDKDTLLLEACRAIEGLGASALKVPFVDDPGLEALTSEIKIPVWVLGGEKVEESLAYELARRYLSLGARGIVFGRNVIQADDPGSTAARLREIIHAQK